MTDRLSERGLRVANAVMACLFACSMYLRHQDASAANWTAVYGVAAVLCVSAVLGRPRWKLSGLLCLLATVAAVVILWGGIGPQSLWESDRGRDFVGMALVSVWMGLLTVWWRHLGPGMAEPEGER